MSTTLVVGIMFSPNKKSVILLKKRKSSNPVISGRWNFPGGHVEASELPLNACVREIKEETGIITNPNQWRHLATGIASNRSLQVMFFDTVLSEEQWNSDWGTRTDEFVAPDRINYTMDRQRTGRQVHNVAMLIGLALDDLALNDLVVLPLTFQYRYPEEAFTQEIKS